MKTGAIILAAGKGIRMNSELPKVLHRVLNKPLLEYVKENLEKVIDCKPIVVIGYNGDKIKNYFKESFVYAYQKIQKGTGDALKEGIKKTKNEDLLFVICGDSPFLSEKNLTNMKNIHILEKRDATVLTAILENSYGYGRICKNEKGELEKIVEEKDASYEEKKIKEVNSGAYIFSKKVLIKYLKKIKKNKMQKELYLTDLLEIMKKNKEKIGLYKIEDSFEVTGINDKKQLLKATKCFQEKINEYWLNKGIIFEDINTAYIGSKVILNKDVIIGTNVHLEGISLIEKNVKIGANTIIKNSVIGSETDIKYSIVKDSKIGKKCIIGPFAYIRPDCFIGDNVKIGDFVELKKSKIGNHTKIPHHSYIGDAVISEKVNIGAGTITCNYDGKNKNETKIEREVFIGSNTNLVAPVSIGKKAYVAAGSTITKDVPPKTLSIARKRQKNIKNWKK